MKIKNIVEFIREHRMQEVLPNTEGHIYTGKTRVDSVEGANKYFGERFKLIK